MSFPGSPPEIFQLVLKSFGCSLPSLPDYQSMALWVPGSVSFRAGPCSLSSILGFCCFLSQLRVGSESHRPAADELLVEFNSTREFKQRNWLWHVRRNVGWAASVGDDSGVVLAAHMRRNFDLVVKDSLFQFFIHCLLRRIFMYINHRTKGGMKTPLMLEWFRGTKV